MKTIREWLEAIYEREGIGWAIATGLVIVALVVALQYFDVDVNLLEWLN